MDDDEWDKQDFETPVLSVVKTLPATTAAPPAPRSQLVKDSWDDDEDDDNESKTKASWDDDADDLFGDNKKPKEPIKSTPKAAAPKQTATKAKPVTTPATKASAPVAKAAPKAQPQKPSLKGAGAFDPLVDKLQKQKLVERSDLANTKDLFGVEGDDDDDDLPPSATQKQPTSRDLLDSFAGRTEADFDGFAAEIALKLLRHEGSPHFSKFVRALVRQLGQSKKLVAEDWKELSKTVTIVVNEKIAAEKKTQKKKPQAAKKSVKKEELMDDFVEGEYSMYE